MGLPDTPLLWGTDMLDEVPACVLNRVLCDDPVEDDLNLPVFSVAQGASRRAADGNHQLRRFVHCRDGLPERDRIPVREPRRCWDASAARGIDKDQHSIPAIHTGGSHRN